jgi:glutamate N-acetyltransferase/amino-acid N-acetyltransferase
VKRKLFEDWNATIDVSPSDDPSADVLSFHSRTLGRDVAVEPSLVHQPVGLRSAALSAGIKHPGVLDFTVVSLDEPGAAAGVFTTNLCPGFCIPYDREVLADGRAQALAVVSKNANVFTPHGAEDTRTLARWLSEELGIDARDIVLSFTGVIGVALPMDKIQTAVGGIGQRLRPGGLDDVARAILTTDRGPKVCSVRVGDLVVSALAKGAGMIEPNLATMLVYFFTNADVDGQTLRTILEGAVDRSFNSLSVDSDTSTSDSVVIFSTRRETLDETLRADFVDAVRCMSIKLARDIVAQAEGSTKLIDCTVRIDSCAADAKTMAKKVVNSPLVKTAIYGGDPNWGRVVMAIGKPDPRLAVRTIHPTDVAISIADQTVFDRGRPMAVDLAAVSGAIKSSRRIAIDIRIGDGSYAATVWGCDLSHRYIDINADYMT